MTYQLKPRQICLFFIAFLPILKIFMMPSVVSSISNEDAWISTVINCLLDLLTLLVLLYASKLINKPFFLMLEETFGKTGAKIIAFLYFLFFTIKAILPINEQKDYVEFTLYTLISTTFYFFPFFILAF